MHRILNFRTASFVIAFSMILFAACRPTQNNNPNPVDGDDNGGYASDASRIELVNDDVISLADAAGTLYNGAYMRTTHTTALGTCAFVATDTNGDQHTLHIEFGDHDCKCLDGRLRRGDIIIQYMGKYTDSLQTHTITFSNYFINGNELTGTIYVTRIDTTVVGNWYYQVTVNDTLNMSPDPLKSQLIAWNGTLVRQWITGFLTLDRSDDVFSISGNANLTRPNGHQYSFSISAPLRIALGCDYTEAGVVNINGYNGARILNYGGGACDNIAQVTIGLNVNQISLTK
jgi:hypothetical protein